MLGPHLCSMKKSEYNPLPHLGWARSMYQKKSEYTPERMAVLCSVLIGNSSTSWNTVLIEVDVVVYYKSLVLLSLPDFTNLKLSNCKNLIGPLCVHRSYHRDV